jgi:hypothetical protein
MAILEALMNLPEVSHILYSKETRLNSIKHFFLGQKDDSKNRMLLNQCRQELRFDLNSQYHNKNDSELTQTELEDRKDILESIQLINDFIDATKKMEC